MANRHTLINDNDEAVASRIKIHYSGLQEGRLQSACNLPASHVHTKLRRIVLQRPCVSYVVNVKEGFVKGFEAEDPMAAGRQDVQAGIVLANVLPSIF